MENIFGNRTFRKPRETIVQVDAEINWVNLEGFQLNIYLIYEQFVDMGY